MVELHGSYRYATPEALERAVMSAMLQLDDEDDHRLAGDWLRALSRRGTRLEVRATLTTESDPFLASSILAVLSDHAIEGSVDVRRGDAILDSFGPGDED
ncbi:MAG TPA: hypothetical protein VFQ65_27160 [Kofleriaceae bacterium]|nr:hypothetical protein [Kofleriaceae bacterium]